MTYTMENLINDSVKVSRGMIAVFPQYNAEEVINFDGATFNGSYASNNGTLAFVVQNALYVTPSTRCAYQALDEAGFTEKYFYVPFSNGDYPKSEVHKWQLLRYKQKELRKQDFIQDCANYCDEHGIGELKEETLNQCFEMPSNGVRVEYFGVENTIYPHIMSTILDCCAVERIGKYCTNNGRVVFIYRNGKTYVSRGYEILNELKNSGYVEKSLFVPFSNGEEIKDKMLRERWDILSK